MTTGFAMGRWRSAARLATFTIVCHLLGATVYAQPIAAPPEQPSDGPGGATGRFATGRVESERVGEAPTGAWIFGPELDPRAGTAARAEPLPIVIFLHGYTAVAPDRYRAWIDHLVGRAAFVVYPDYQTADARGDDWRRYLPNTVDGIAAALGRIEHRWLGRSDPSKVAVVGHSLGGVLAAGYAASARAAGMPVAAVLMVLQPGGCIGCEPLLGAGGAPLPGMARVPPETRVLVVESAADEVVSGVAADRIWSGLAHIPPERRDRVQLVSDDHGQPPLQANHFLPETGGAAGELNALDWFGPWKLLDLLTDCAFFGTACEQAQGGSPEQRFMGAWSDGVPVREAIVGDSPEAGENAELEERVGGGDVTPPIRQTDPDAA